MSKVKRVSLIISFVVASIIFAGLATKSIIPVKDSSSSVSSPRKISEGEMKKLKQETDLITTKFGKFRRVSSEQSFKTSETAYDLDSVNEQTKVLILDDYDGVFITSKN
ncbi:hypothetical protein [Paenibacillus hexagrammi]|uniref:Uncharacterized protein n=1 Tax=Paenibacillus hexagrammi TaxID=2908839 RepID=A0ABY3SJT5_9BACL|nr:hypothetical protein [Paenibacillus sp. YPD9-1]UJF33400.1 hypothetical protein L0M14_28485 [Paenibacillus sp. YPD9-1]